MLAAAGITIRSHPRYYQRHCGACLCRHPLTYRKMAQSFTVITGHTCGDQPCSIDWEDLPGLGLVILMGIKTWPISPSGWCSAGEPAALRLP